MKSKVSIILVIVALFFSGSINAQDMKSVYNPEADAKLEVQKAVKLAKKENKHVFIQIGGDWCPWCLKMHEFYNSDTEIDSIMSANYVRMLVYYNRREEKNVELMKELGFPQRFGFPVIVILDGEGTRLHTQDSRFLENGSEYNRKYFLEFIKDWTPEAINPDNY